jgi:tetratricopeptide (TPR) repeat protein
MRYWLSLLLLLTPLAAAALLAQDSNSHSMSGIVREEGSNRPIASATVELSLSGVQVATPLFSGTGGEFAFHGLEPGEYVVSVKKEGFSSASVNVQVLRSGAPDIRISLHRTAPAPAGDVVSGGPISAHQLQAPHKARAAYEKGRRLLEEKNNPAASIPAFEKAVGLFPGYYEAYAELGIADYRLGRSADAEASLKKAVELSQGKYVEAFYGLADIYNTQGNYQRAEALARQAIAVDDSVWRSFFELARALVGLKRATEAETNAQRARELAPKNPRVYLLLANVHVLQLNYQAAVQDCDAYLELDANGPISEAVRVTREKLKNQTQSQGGTNSAATPTPGASQEQPLALGNISLDVGGHEGDASAPGAKSKYLNWSPPHVDAPLSSLAANPACDVNKVLAEVGAHAVELARNLQNFTAEEEIRYEKSSYSGVPEEDDTGMFHYVFAFEQHSGDLVTQEYRNPWKGGRSFPASGQDTGEVTLELIFRPEMQTDYEMSCEGRDPWKGQEAWVIRFQQRKDKPRRTMRFQIPGGETGVMLKGRAWIGVESGQVLHMESNLMQDLPQVGLRSGALAVDYAPVEIRSRKLQLWLPQEVEAFWEFGTYRLILLHTFRDFKLFTVETEENTPKSE